MTPVVAVASVIALAVLATVLLHLHRKDRAATSTADHHLHRDSDGATLEWADELRCWNLCQHTPIPDYDDGKLKIEGCWYVTHRDDCSMRNPWRRPVLR